MEKVTFLDIREKIDGKSIILSQLDLTRSLQTIWDLFLGHFEDFSGFVGLAVTESWLRFNSLACDRRLHLSLSFVWGLLLPRGEMQMG